MQVDRSVAIPDFSGSAAQKSLAELAYRAFLARGAFFSASAPIELTVEQIVEFLASTGNDTTANAVDKALSENSEIFLREERGDDIVFITTRSGKPPADTAPSIEADHDLRERFTTPEPPRPRVQTHAEELSDDFLLQETESEPAHAFPADSWQAAVAAALREAEADQEAAGAEGDMAAEISEAVVTDEAEVVEATVEPEAEVAEEVIAEEPVAAPAEDDGEVIDVASASDEELAEAIEAALNSAPEVVRWGETWMAEENVPRLSRGDIRRLQEFISEADGPLGDVELVQDLRGIMPNAPEFETERFGLNYRMSRELREFEFVGTAKAPAWIAAGQQTIGSDKRKVSEIGQDYRFLLDYRTPDAELEEGIVEHVLSFYEFYVGVLPLDANMATLMPRAAFNDQRATRLTFESPQTGETFPIELHYPRSNRGGYLIGFEEFFEANLVPGAVVTIERLEGSEIDFIIEYFQVSRQDRKLLHLDEKRGRYVFRGTTYYCATQDEMLLDENHFEKLEGVEPLAESVRRRPEEVVAKTFERIGENVEMDGQKAYRASLLDLLAVANIERPISEEYMRDILSGGAYPEFLVDESEEDYFFYVPTE